MKDRYRKQKFLKHFDLIPHKNPARYLYFFKEINILKVLNNHKKICLFF